MKNKLIKRILGLALAVCSVICIFTACDNSDLIPSDSETNQEQNINDNSGDDNSTQDHTHVYNETVVNPTCTEQGYTLHSCTICSGNYKDTYTAALGHNYEWTTTKAPTETEKGIETGVCSRCKGTITRDIPELNHEHIYSETVIAPTCTEKGYTLHKCSCGAEYRTDETNETGHDYGDWIETIAPTCTEEGEMQRVCRKDLTHKETMAITPTGHKFSSEWTYDSGYHYHASTCGHNVVSDRTAHDFKTDMISVTCDTDGYTLHTCKTCGYFYTDNNIPATGHSYSNEWTTDADYHWHAATCGHNLVKDKTAHNFGAPTTVTPSCETDGYDYKICSDCGYELRYNIVPALGHLKSDVKVKTLVKASDSGYGYYTKEFSCERCNQVISSQYTMIQPNGATTNSAQGEWEENTVFSNVPYPQNGICVSLVTSTENTAVGSYKGTVGAIFENITRDQVKSYTQTLKSYGYRKTVSEQDYYAYSFTAYHNTLNIFIAVGFDGSRMSIAAYKTGEISKSSNAGIGVSDVPAIYDITATDGLSFTLSSDGKSYSVFDYNGTEDYVVIPSKVNGVPVKDIARSCFQDKTDIKVVIILADLETIGEQAFIGCTSLRSIVLPDGVTSIGNYAFRWCWQLSTIDLPNSIQRIGVAAFADCSGLTAIVIPESVTRILTGTFSGCSRLSDVTIPDSVTEIMNNAFEGCGKLTKINLPSSLTNVSYGAFPLALRTEYGGAYYYGSLLVKADDTQTAITIKSGTKSIADGAFSGCDKLTEITLPSSVEYIGKQAFANCVWLKTITLSANLKGIGEQVFLSCSSLTKMYYSGTVSSWAQIDGLGNLNRNTLLYINGVDTVVTADIDGITEIKPYAFYFLSSIYELNIGSSVEKIADTAFDNCSRLETITVSDENPYYSSQDGVLYDKAKTRIIYVPESIYNSIEIPDGVTEINVFDFYGCTSLTELTIGNGVTSIADGAFGSCVSLENITVSDGNTNYSSQDGVLYDKAKSTIISVPKCVHGALTIPNSVKSITNNAFIGRNYITEIFFDGDVADWLDIAFGNEYANPLSCGADLYIKANGVFKILTSITVPDSVTEIKDYAFYGWTYLNDITIPNSITQIGSFAFYNCTNLTALTITGNITSIGDYAFYNCGKITTIIVPDNVSAVGNFAFYNCSGLETITIGSGVTFLGESFLDGCNALRYISVSEDNSSYSSVSGILYDKQHTQILRMPSIIEGEIIIPDGITTIKDGAFRNCTGLTEITIPDSVISIEEGAFSGCSSLERITLPFVGESVKTSSNTYQYPFGYIFGTSRYTGGVETSQSYKGSSTSSTTSTTYYIPSSLKSVTVTGGNILYGAFYNCSGLSNITISDSVTSIENYAFYNCSKLESATIGNGVTSIGSYAFSGCSSLTSETIPDSVTSIGSSAFNGCSSLQSITIPFVGSSKTATSASLSTLFGYIFGTGSYTGGVATTQYYYSGSRTTYYIPSSLKSVAVTGGNVLYGAFYGCSGLMGITIPDSVTSIGDYAFYNCSKLESATIGNGVTSIGSYAFSGCSSLTKITIPDSATSIGRSAFYGCSSLESITIPFVGATLNGTNNTHFGYVFGASGYSSNSFYVPASLKAVVITGGNNIENFAFYNCSGLTSITIPDSVTIIGSSAFDNCSGLASITIPDSVTSIGDYAFCGCSELIDIKVDATNQKYISENNCLIEKETNTLILGCRNSIIPDSVTIIGDYAFYNCSSLTSITISDSVTSIGSYAFSCCSSLTEIIIPDSVTSIEYEAFSGCSSLTNVTIGNGVTSIGNSAFYNCSSLKSVTIGNGVTSIGSSAFYGCSSLTSVTCPAFAISYIPEANLKTVIITSGETIEDYAFDNYTSLTSVTIGNSVTSIGRYAFYGCSSMTNIAIPDGVMSIDDYAFYGCESLCYYEYGNACYLGNDHNGYIALVKPYNTSISSCDINSNTKVICNRAFENYSSLTSIIIPDSVTRIGDYAFYNCSGLMSVTISDSVTSIGSSAFYNCSGLTSATIPDSVTSIGSYVFYNCSSLTSIIIPDSVTSIGNGAFRGCSSLTNITIPDSVTRIGSSAFYNCSSLTNITIPDSVTSIGSYAFYGCESLYYYEYDNALYLGNENNHFFALIKSYNTSITSCIINNSTKIIADNAFYNCASLSRIVIPDSVTSIGSCAFYGDNSISMSLTSVTIGNGVTSIGAAAFYHCINLTSVTIGKSVTSIGSSAFKYCVKLASITIPNSVTSIGDSAFYQCERLSRIVIPDSVTSIGSNAFENCSSLTSVTIGNGVTSIGNSAFYYCSSLTSITFKDTSMWYRTNDSDNWKNRTGGTQTSVTNVSTNATYFKSDYYKYYWYKL